MKTHGIFDEEAHYEELRRLGQQLRIPIPEAYWECEVRDRHGKAIQRLRQHSHSWVRNAYNWLLSQLAGAPANDSTFGAGYVNIKNTGGSVLSGSNYRLDLRSPSNYLAGAGDASFGIQVGAGTNPDSFEDYALQAQIPHGVSSGQLSHTEVTRAESYDAPTKVYRVEMVRYFNNNSGADIDVNEVGLAPKISASVDSGGYAPSPTLVARDKLPSTVTVPNTGQLKVTYVIQLTYPA
jgi:hypothetical protein